MLENRLMLVATLFCAFGAFGSRLDGSQPLFVDPAAPGPNHDGQTWCTAFTDLQDALAEARRTRVAEIRIAQGTYHPAPPNGDRGATFLLDGDFTLRGGYAGCAADDPDARDFVRHETILSGDLNDDDVYDDCRDFSNCCVEHEGAGCDDPDCEALICDFGSARICCDPHPAFNRWADICAAYARVLCMGKFNNRSDNTTNVVTTKQGLAWIEGLTISGGYKDTLYGPSGSAVANFGRLTLRHVVVTQNEIFSGSGVACHPQATLLVDRSHFEDNNGGIGSIPWDDTYIEVVRSSFRNGGGVGGMRLWIRDSVFQNPESLGAGHGGRFHNSLIERCLFIGNQTGVSASFANSLLTVQDCDFVGNTSRGLVNSSSPTLVKRCRFWGNSVNALRNNNGFLQIEDSLIVHNGKGPFTAVSNDGGTLHLFNSTIADNHTTSWTSGVYVNSGTVRVKNSIIWGNRADRQQGEEAQFDAPWTLGGITAFVDHSIIEDWTGDLGWPGNIVGVGNSAADPLFRDPLGPDGIPGTADDDYRLSPDSPAIDAGDPAPNPAQSPGLRTDLDGVPRILCGRVDLGAYEFGLGDFNCDRTADLTDFAAFPPCQTGPVCAPLAPGCEAFDANADGLIDLADFARLQRLLTAE